RQAVVRAVRARLPAPARGRELRAPSTRGNPAPTVPWQPALEPTGDVLDLVERDHGRDVHRATPPVRRTLRAANRSAVTTPPSGRRRCTTSRPWGRSARPDHRIDRSESAAHGRTC